MDLDQADYEALNGRTLMDGCSDASRYASYYDNEQIDKRHQLFGPHIYGFLGDDEAW